MHLTLNCINSRSVYSLHLVTTLHNQETMSIRSSKNAIYFQHIRQTMPMGWHPFKWVYLYLSYNNNPYNFMKSNCILHSGLQTKK